MKDNNEYLGKFHWFEMKISKLINYSTNMFWNDQGTMVVDNEYGS